MNVEGYEDGRRESGADAPLWTPSPERAASSGMAAFRRFCEGRAGRSFAETPALHYWSLAEPAAFWEAVWDLFGVVGEKGGRRLVDGDRMPGARFFPDARLNYAENLLRPAGGVSDEDDALVFRAEDRRDDRWSWGRLRAEVSRLQQAMRAMGLRPGDRAPPCCRTDRRPSRPCLPAPRSARCDARPRPTSARAASSTASG